MRKKASYIVATVCFIIAFVFAYHAGEVSAEIARMEYSPLPENEWVGDPYRDERASAIVASRAELSSTIVITLLWVIVGSVIALYTMTAKKGTAILPLVLLLMVFAHIPQATAGNLGYFQPRVNLPTVSPTWGRFDYVEVKTTVTEGIYKTGFIAALLAVGDPISRDFIEVGWIRRGSSYWVYTAWCLDRVYNYKNVQDAYVGESYTFKIRLWIDLKWAELYINGAKVNDQTFHVKLTEYAVQAETTSFLNNMSIVFTDMYANRPLDPFGFPTEDVRTVYDYPYNMKTVGNEYWVWDAATYRKLWGAPHGGGHITIDQDSMHQ